MQVVFVGPVGAGKTCLVQKIAYGETLNSLSTTAACCYRCDDLPETLLYDTPGDDRFSWAYDGIMRRADILVYCVPPGEAHSRNYFELNPNAQVLKVHTKADTTQLRHRETDNFDTSVISGEGVNTLKDRLRSERERRILLPGSFERAQQAARLKPRKARTCF